MNISIYTYLAVAGAAAASDGVNDVIALETHSGERTACDISLVSWASLYLTHDHKKSQR